MTVIVDTSPVNYLIQIGEVDLLQNLYGSVVMPPAVRSELLADRAAEIVKLWGRNLPRWARIETPIGEQLSLLATSLDLGEREAIALAFT